MIRGLFAKTLRETWPLTLGIGLALMGVIGILTFVLPMVQEGMTEVLEQIPFARSMLSTLLGTELGNEIGARTMQAFLWAHPVVLALSWAHVIAFCTRVPAGEIDRGTIDFLLGLPISRRALYWCEVIVWLASGMFVLLMGYLGHRLMSPTMPEAMRPDVFTALLVLTNLYCVYLAVGGFAFLVSALSDRRGRAMAVVFGVVLASFLLNFVAQVWEPAKNAAFLGVMDYYQPAKILQTGQFPWFDIAILVGLGALSLLAAGEIVARRSICTV